MSPPYVQQVISKQFGENDPIRELHIAEDQLSQMEKLSYRMSRLFLHVMLNFFRCDEDEATDRLTLTPWFEAGYQSASTLMILLEEEKNRVGELVWLSAEGERKSEEIKTKVCVSVLRNNNRIATDEMRDIMDAYEEVMDNISLAHIRCMTGNNSHYNSRTCRRVSNVSLMFQRGFNTYFTLCD